ncbi:MAG: hypothetical protein K9K34_19005 [Desulfarculaceae bacterium]|nr:hypothetical protein [Desulfarculaceae bacterium]
MVKALVVFHDHWDEFASWRRDPAHPGRRDLPILEALNSFMREQEGPQCSR